MTDLPEDERDEDKKKKGEGEEGAAASRGEVSVSPAFFEYMAGIGASKELIAEVLRTWRHFKGEGLFRRIWDFTKNLVKSTHVQVEIDRGKDYAVLHNFVESTKQPPAQNLTAQQNHAHKHPQGMDPNMAPRPK